MAVTTQTLVSNQLMSSICTTFNQEDTVGMLNIVLSTASRCEPDCICPVVFVRNQNCYSADSCSCVNRTNFLNSLEICLVQSTTLQLCINNITDKMNNSHLHIFQTKFSSCYQYSLLYSYRKYIKAFTVLLLGNNNNIIIYSWYSSFIYWMNLI